MSNQTKGWIFVSVQFALLIILVTLPESDDWPTPTWLEISSYVALAAGLLVMGASSITLGRSLTPNPQPAENAQLVTNGLYNYVRHPIYTGLILAATAVAAKSGSFLVLAVAATLHTFLHFKANWEEQRLLETYEDYEAYMQKTKRIVPKIW